MNMKRPTFYFIILGCLLFYGKPAISQTLVATDGYVEFISTAPLLTFKGTSDNLAGLINLETGEVDFFVDLASLDTGNRRRDRDMRQVYLETEKYPFAEFEGRLTSHFNPEISGEQQATVTGSFTMREISRDMTVSGTMEATEEGIRVRAGWEIRLEDFDIERPGILFYELSEVQTVNIDILLRPDDEN